MLVVLEGYLNGSKRLEVFRSPWVRNDDKLFQPVVGEVVGQCLTVHKEVFEDPGFALGQAQYYSIDVLRHCPDTDHYCNAPLDEVFAV